MKKILVIAAAALAFAACSKTEIFAPETSAINFAPNALSTKALILPDENLTDTLAFPTEEAFNVFAFADLGDGNGTIYATPIMNDVEISFHQTTNGGDWKSTTGTYLWPATGTVDFYAYYPGSLNATFVANDPKHLELTDIQLGTSIGSQIDPLVAQVLGQSSVAKKKVSLVFKHITSQIVVKAFDATETASLQGRISIEKVVFKNMKTSGSYSEGTSLGKGIWSNINDKTNFTSFYGSEVLTTTESILSGDSFSNSIDNSAAFVVIPEDIVETGDIQSIEVTYSVASYKINNFTYPATPSTTVNIPLYGRVSMNKLQNGKRYVFHIGLSLDKANNEIMFSPVVVGWDTEDIRGITIDVVNSENGSTAILL